MALNIITAKFCSGATQTWTEEAWQYDYGQVLQFDGLELPGAYEVHFSNTPMTGETITQIGGADGVTVPDQFFTGGETIYAWVYLHEGEDDGETVYMVTIPVKKRPQPSDDVPTPVEQSAIDQAIAALNIAVEKADEAITHYPTIIDGTWHVWDVTEEEYVDTGVQAQGHDGEDGVSPEITVQDITNGHRVTITDATGTTTFDVMDGENGADGISPDVSIQNITNGHRVTITDAGGTHTFDVMDGEPGEPGATGNGIASITKTGTSGLVDTYTITYTNGQTTTFTVTNGSDATVTVDDELSTTSTNPVQNKVVTEELNDVKADLNQFPPIKDSDATGVDLDVSDEDGNVLARFKNGEIQTKEFDSNTVASSDGQLTDPDTDLYLTDASGNALARFVNGHFGTARFSSGDINHSKTFTITSGSGSQTINHFFPEGTQIALHMCQLDVKGWYAIKSYKLTYKYTDKSSVDHTIGQDYGFNFFRYTLPEDVIAISVSYPNDLTPGTYTFTAYTEASFNKKPKIITVAADGSKEYTSLRSAIDSIPVDVCEMNPYEIHIYPGTYNVLSDYTAAEISEAGFKGLWLVNGMSLIGIGRRDEIVIHGELDRNTYDQTKRNDVSTLNVLGNIHVENVTIEAYYIRYAVHDEEMTYKHHLSKHYWKSVKFYGNSLTSGGGGNTSYGSGTRSYVEHEYIDCDFSDSYVLHTDSNIVHPVYARYENCNARKFRFGDYDTGGTVCHAYFYNCKAVFICIEAGTVHDQYFYIHGEGINDVMVKCPSGYVYETGDTLRFYDDEILAGKAVKIVNLYDSRQSNLVVTSDITDIYGISIGTIGDDTIIQTKGYINSNTLGLSGLAVGDYLTVDATGVVVSGGTAANAIAVVKMIDNDGVAYAKLMI